MRKAGSPKRRLRVLRADAALSQMEVARRLKIPLNRYWHIENGYTTPKPAERDALARILKTDLADVWPEPEEAAS